MTTFQSISQTLLLSPIFELLKFLTIQTGNFGVAIILMTVIIRTLLIPFTLPTLKSQQKMRAIKPELDKLKAKHKNDPKKMQQAQMDLFKEHNINPLGGCIPYIAQFIVLIALYNVLRTFVSTATGMGLTIQTSFLFFDLSKPDHSLVIPIIAAVTQLILSLQILPGTEKHDLIPNNSKNKKVQEANAKEADTQEMAESMQKQMVFMMPIMTGIFAYQFPAGLGIYWITTTVYSIAQQWMVSGPGGLFTTLDAVKKRFIK
jgi:YidC/Oxa1 family membrane protein insertase